MRCDFVDDGRYATDCGPTCVTVGCYSTLWIYLVDDQQLGVMGQCAACHGVETFRIAGVTVRADVTIGDIKRAHFEHAVHRRVTPAYRRA
jgi:hypothetical protein